MEIMTGTAPNTGLPTSLRFVQIAFGDFGYYWIADRAARSIKRLNELYAKNDQVGFKCTQRVDGKLVLAEAVKALAMKA